MKKMIWALILALCVIAVPASAAVEPHVPVCTEAQCPVRAPEPVPAPQIAYVKLDTAIDGAVAERMVATVDAINEAKIPALVVEINSPGGSVSAGFLIAKAFEQSPATIYCVVDGMAASMAAYILQSCDVRMMTDRSTIMFHNPSSYALAFGGQEDEWRTQGQNVADALRAMGKAMARHCSHRLNIPFKQFWAKIDHGREYWLERDEALTVGAVNWAQASVVNAMEIIEAMEVAKTEGSR